MYKSRERNIHKQEPVGGFQKTRATRPFWREINKGKKFREFNIWYAEKQIKRNLFLSQN